ncbi:hypothetical protein J5N97_000337 [Dioscorea zingiberensis]|uniref:Uncharacterized protein n=1 Tax=Dioscorea zingiberensis TaxID=325984 RepID=A0A9D5BSL6_9LILI|nr:hypothetical protein J5N97_000337 [Dioscorea zingiberensis]
MAIRVLRRKFAALLLVFFFTSSKLTKVREEKKRGIDAEFKEGGHRNWIQVLANSAIATILVIVAVKMTKGEDRCLDTKDSSLVTGLIDGIIEHYGCCNRDTWSSEIGMLSDAQPRLITTFKVVSKQGPTVVKISGSSILDNNVVNACSILLTTLLTSMACMSIF